MKKSNLTGAVAAVDGKVLNKRIATNPNPMINLRRQKVSKI
ncbi:MULTISPECIES: hypothetical protein [Sphingobacterium]|nr:MULTISPECIES: hypothetical protein [Sphingobacterium]